MVRWNPRSSNGMIAEENRSLRNDNKISRQYNLHFQKKVVVAFPTKKNSVLDDFPLCPQFPPPAKNRKFYFYCRLAVSEKNKQELSGKGDLQRD